jgi:GntR family transcriptional regulator
MLQLNPKDHAPIYEQIKEQLKTMIVSGVLKPDDKIPSVRELAQMLTINPNTIQKAYKELEQEGFIYSVRGKGSFVTPQDNTLRNIRQHDLLTDLEKTVRELMYIQVPCQELVSIIEKIYKEEEGDNND